MNMIVENDEWEVLTPSGYQSFRGIKHTKKLNNLEFKFTDGTSIIVSKNHKFQLKNKTFIYAKDLNIGDVLIKDFKIQDIVNKDDEIDLYDLLDVENGNIYFTNGIVSHNCAFIQNAGEIWTSAQQTLATGGDAIILSTPYGIGNFFHKMWIQAEEGSNGFNTIRLPWHVHPERTQEWRDAQTQQLGEKKAAQECDCIGYDSILTLQHIDTGDLFRIPIGDCYNMLPGNIIHNNLQYKILTNNDFEYFTGIKKIVKDEYLDIKLSNGNNLICSPEHILITDNNLTQIEAQDLKPGEYLKGVNDDVLILDVKHIYKEIELFDIINSGKDNLFYTQGILSHNCSFETSGNSVIELEILEEYRETQTEPPMEKSYIDKNLWRWDYPRDNYKYMVVADVARGDGTDYSAFHVIDIENIEQVAEYRGKIGVKEYGNLLVNVATEYNDAVLVIENVGVGLAVIQVVLDRAYKNLFYSYKNDGYVDPSIHINRRYDIVDSANKVPGFTTSGKTRPLIISKLETYFRERLLTIKSERLINELQTFVWNGSKAEARVGYNDDLVMAFGIGCFVRDTALRLHDEGIKYSKSAASGIRSSKSVYGNMGSKYSSQNMDDYGWLLNKK